MITELKKDFRDKLKRLLDPNLTHAERDKKLQYQHQLIDSFKKTLEDKYRYYCMRCFTSNGELDYTLYGYIPKGDVTVNCNNKFELVINKGIRCVYFAKTPSKNFKDRASLLIDLFSDRTTFTPITKEEFVSLWETVLYHNGIAEADKNYVDKAIRKLNPNARYRSTLEAITDLEEPVVYTKQDVDNIVNAAVVDFDKKNLIEKAKKMEEDFKVNEPPKPISITINKDEFNLPDDFFADFNLDFDNEWGRILAE